MDEMRCLFHNNSKGFDGVREMQTFRDFEVDFSVVLYMGTSYIAMGGPQWSWLCTGVNIPGVKKFLLFAQLVWLGG